MSDEETQIAQPTRKRRAPWKDDEPKNPDQNHSKNDFVKPTNMDDWMTEDEFLDYVTQHCAVGHEGSWELRQPQKDSRQLLRVRAQHTHLKHGRYAINTPPIRCRYIESEDAIYVSKPSFNNFKENSPDLGLAITYPDIFATDVHSHPVEDDKPKKVKGSKSKD